MVVGLGVAITLNLTPENYEKLVTLSKFLGISKSAIINFMLDSPTNCYVLLLAYAILRNPTLENLKEVIR